MAKLKWVDRALFAEIHAAVARRAERGAPGGRPPLDPLHLSNLVC